MFPLSCLSGEVILELFKSNKSPRNSRASSEMLLRLLLVLLLNIHFPDVQQLWAAKHQFKPKLKPGLTPLSTFKARNLHSTSFRDFSSLSKLPQPFQTTQHHLREYLTRIIGHSELREVILPQGCSRLCRQAGETSTMVEKTGKMELKTSRDKE